jgi:hypothetical protein
MKQLTNLWGQFASMDVLLPDQVANGNFEPKRMMINKQSIALYDKEPIIMQKQNKFSNEPVLVAVECPDEYYRIISSSPIMPVFFAKKVVNRVNIFSEVD